MEEGLKTSDPHDCSTYTGWTGEVPQLLENNQKYLRGWAQNRFESQICEKCWSLGLVLAFVDIHSFAISMASP